MPHSAWERNEVVRSLGNEVVRIAFEQEGDATVPTARQLQALDSLHGVPGDELARDIAVNARRYYERVDSVVNLAGEGIDIDPENIASHFKIVGVTIPILGGCESDLIFVDATCDWEEEHGMQLLLADGSVVYCGDYSTIQMGPQWRDIISAPTRDKSVELLSALLKALD